MKLKDIINEITVWDEWRNAYNHFVPQFIEEAKNKANYTDWHPTIFKEFFERSSGQCVSSLKQGYFTNAEKSKIKENWRELSPLLKKIAESQEIPLWEVYEQIQSTIKKYTESNRKSATYRLIASLQPRLLSTIVNQKGTKKLLYYLNKNGELTENIPNYTGNWFKDSHSIFTFYKNNSDIGESSQFMTYPWQTIVYFEEDFDKNKDRDMSDISNELANIKELLEYKKQIILQGPPGTGKTKTAKELAIGILHLQDIKDLNDSEQFKLIQFHPSYSYEDFIRGIVSKPNENGEGVLYKTENKVLAEFADKALRNKLNTQKNSIELSKEKWLNEQFEKFVDFISDEIEQKLKIELTESVFIIELDEDAFRYKGLEGWSKKGNRMLFNDIKQAYLDDNIERQNVKHNQNLSGLAKWHASYYIRVLDMFRKFLNDQNLIFVANNTEREELKKYILIIDEINRSNLPSVLGELIYGLEYRNEPVESIYEFGGKTEIILPSNLYIIGTMNTADRSVGHIDYAIRRRFAFMDILPKDLSDEKEIIFDSQLFQSVKDFFTTDDYKTRSIFLSTEFEPKDVALGHSYFIDKAKDGGSMNIRLEYEIKPILREYIKDGILKEIAREKIEQLTTSI